MTESNDPLTANWRSTSGSSLGRADLLRRLRKLPIPGSALPRVLRFVEVEIEQALAAQAADSFTTAEIEEVTGDPGAGAKLRTLREQREKVAAIREAGLADLSKDDLERVLEEARATGERS